MSFIDARMPERISTGFKIGPEWYTEVQPMENGREKRARKWLYPKYRGQANLGAFSATDRQALIGLFLAAGGKHKAFRVKDPTDFVVSSQAMTVPAGQSTAVQLVKTYTFGPTSTDVLVQAPVSGTVAILKDGSPYADCTVDYATGLVTPTTTWASGTYTYSGQFDRWMRFDSDWGAFTATTPGIWTTDIDLVEVRR